MLADITRADRIFIVTGYTDMRKSIDGLCAVVMDLLHEDAGGSTLYLFCGKRCDRIKALIHEPDGFVRHGCRVIGQQFGVHLTDESVSRSVLNLLAVLFTCIHPSRE